MKRSSIVDTSRLLIAAVAFLVMGERAPRASAQSLQSVVRLCDRSSAVYNEKRCRSITGLAAVSTWEQDFRRCAIYKKSGNTEFRLFAGVEKIELTDIKDGESAPSIYFDNKEVSVELLKSNAGSVYGYGFGPYAAALKLLEVSKVMTITFANRDSQVIRIEDGKKQAEFLRKCTDFWAGWRRTHP